jgi:hypothetical protein
MTVVIFYISDAEIGLGGQLVGGGALIYWLRHGRGSAII